MITSIINGISSNLLLALLSYRGNATSTQTCKESPLQCKGSTLVCEGLWHLLRYHSCQWSNVTRLRLVRTRYSTYTVNAALRVPCAVVASPYKSHSAWKDQPACGYTFILATDTPLPFSIPNSTVYLKDERAEPGPHLLAPRLPWIPQ